MKKDRLEVQEYLDGRISYHSLSIDAERYYKRALAIFDMMLEGIPESKIRKVIADKYLLLDAQAFHVVKAAKEIFGPMQTANKIVARHIAANLALKAFEVAAGKDDPKAMSSAVRAYIEATGLNQQDPDLPPLEKMEPSVNLLSIPAPMADAIQQMLQGGALDLAKLAPPAAPEFAPYEELPGTND